MGVETALIIGLGAAIGVGAAAATGAFSGGGPSAPSALPASPSTAEAEEKAAAEAINARKRRVAKAKTILTSAQGDLGTAPVATKTLLGE
jgi:hypothetical protein